MDVVVTALGDRAELWKNTSPAGNAWLRVRLTGTRSNRDGIGAVVEASGQVNPMTSAVGYASSSHDGVHFGLGQAEAAQVRVRWPGGRVHDLGSVEANTVLEVREAF